MSIRRYLVLILLSIITLVTFIAAIQGYRASMLRASDLFDTQLSSIAETLVVLLPENESLLQSQQSLLVKHSDMAFQLWTNQKLVLKTSNAPNQAMVRWVDGQLKAGFQEENFSGKRWRILVKSLKSPTHTHWVIVAQPIQKRFELAEDVILSAVTPIIIAMPFLALFIWFAIQRALQPLTHLTQALTQKKANDLSLLSINNQTGELVPVVQTLNNLFERLDSAFERERRFASDAAHELRTPLSVLKVNVYNVQHECQQELQSMTHLVQSVDRMAHVVDQILMLNRTNPEQISVESQQINFKSLIVQIISDLYPEISQRKQIISLQSEDITMMAHEFSLHTLALNLISNASKYTPPEGQIVVSINENSETITLIVEDSGPGIDEKEFAQVFNRFYRVGGDQHNSSIIGCGLGLSIVKHIAMLHNADIELSKSELLSGLKVSVAFPKQQASFKTAASLKQSDNV